ncbi:uncharacterized protein P174DRAFT_429297 [Aspergillus novofumigatus IBT 16806]|uniref:Uncharacterized protein n=1 Tax=Aspergillus novofumigatus (strain IBT 16806) TaxID=1392255 RepID=A0A2I1CBA3_ASPN1|nr:uncharacterized protein P174DRAFT_429297 [Aspergillus novofumigatus IBT 16806]PKX94856.1 hypothetical protein P174DRAFT_429297 [Aspergillus novofumigatus IBT 16806]
MRIMDVGAAPELQERKLGYVTVLRVCVYGVRQDGVCRVDPANLLHVYFLAILRAFSLDAKAAKLDLQRGALGEMDLERSVECATHLVFECTDSSSPLNTYLNDLASYYRQRGADEFSTLLSAWIKYGVFNQSRGIKGSRVDATPRNPGKPKQHIEEARELLFQLGLN